MSVSRADALVAYGYPPPSARILAVAAVGDWAGSQRRPGRIITGPDEWRAAGTSRGAGSAKTMHTAPLASARTQASPVAEWVAEAVSAAAPRSEVVIRGVVAFLLSWQRLGGEYAPSHSWTEDGGVVFAVQRGAAMWSLEVDEDGDLYVAQAGSDVSPSSFEASSAEEAADSLWAFCARRKCAG